MSERRRWAAGGVAAVLTAALLAVGGQQQAAAESCDDDEKILVDLGGGNVEYQCPITDPGTDGSSGSEGPGGDGGAETGGGPSCDLSAVENKGRQDASTSRFCEGDNACFINFPSSVYPDPEDWPPGQPTEDSVYTYKACYAPDGTRVSGDWGWFVPDTPSLGTLARQAYGQLQLPSFTLAFSPPGRTVVLIETWWWAEGPSNEPVPGTPAASVVAIAEPDRLEVDPGDGTGPFTCPFITAEADDCTHVYRRASTEGTAEAADGSAAYPARARLVYDVRFENNGGPLDLPGLPESIETEWVETPVPVTEVQAVVTD